MGLNGRVILPRRQLDLSGDLVVSGEVERGPADAVAVARGGEGQQLGVATVASDESVQVSQATIIL